MITEQHIRDILGFSHTVAASAGEEMALSEDFWESSLQTATERFQRAYLTRVLRSCGGNIRAAAGMRVSDVLVSIKSWTEWV